MAERFVRRKILPFAKQLVQDIKQDDLSGLAAELAYRFFLSLFPFFLFVAALGGFAADLFDTDNPTDGIIDLLGESVPQDVASVLRTQVDAVIEARNVGLISIGILGALWTASSGIGTLIKGLNRIHAVKEHRPFWKRFAVSIGLTLLAGGSLIVAFLVLIIGHVYGLKIANEIGMEGLAAQLFTLSRWPLVIVAVLTAVAFLYWAAPNAKLPFRWLTPGSALFTSAWLLLNYLFGVYLANFGSYNTTYGALGGVVIVLVWFYLTGFLLVLGAEVNSLFHVTRERPERGAPAAPDRS